MIGAFLDSIPLWIKAVFCLPSLIIFWAIVIFAIGLFAPGPKAPDAKE
jgi:hypothetical protein